MFRWLNRRLDARGFSLTEVMVGGAILAGVAVAGARLFKDQRQSQAKLDADQLLQQFHQNLTKFIQDDRNCNATLAAAGWYNKTPAQVITSTFTNFYPCSNCNTMGFNYDLSNSTAAATRYIGVNDWIENVNGQTNKQLGLWKVKSINWKPDFNQPLGSGTYMIRVTYKMKASGTPADPAETAAGIDWNGTRATKTVEVSKDIALNLRFTQNAVATSRQLKDCVSPKESSINNLQNDICETMTQVTSTGNIMGWTDASQGCKLAGSGGAPVKTCPNPGEVVQGINSDGTVHCVLLINGVDPFGDLVDPSAPSCAPGTSVKLVIDPISKKLKQACY